MASDEYPDLGYADVEDAPETLDSYINSKSKRFEPEPLITPVADPHSNIGITEDFAASTQIVHFGGFKVGEEMVQEINIVNRNMESRRIQIMPLETDYFKLEYKLSGIMAPGMSQKIRIIFRPKEYKYHYDCIRINGGEKYLLIPMHAYPIVNKVDFPSVMSFGNCPLTEPTVRTFSMRCTIPVAFSYRVEVVRPHPYFHITPMEGTIPANGKIDIKVTFFPITLGSCTMTMRLFVSQHNFVPMDCMISGRAVSGLIEARDILEAHGRVTGHMKTVGGNVHDHLGDSTFRSHLKSKMDHTMAFTNGTQESDASVGSTSAAFHESRKFKSHKILAPAEESKDHYHDPAALMLASTFRSQDTATALDNVVHMGTLLRSKEQRERDVDVVPRGPGSGAVFDAGGQFMASKRRRQLLKKMTMDMTAISEEKMGLLPPPDEDKLVEGLRVPPSIVDVEPGHAVPGVNFLITQEVGKLKPKDLKVAIQKNREEKERRAEEQRAMREVGGGAGMLDLNAILAEERVNDGEQDAMKRQMRELAFLADIDDLQKQDAEKQFRVSEEFVGSDILKDEDVATVMEQRRVAALHTARDEWRRVQARQANSVYPPHNPEFKAGAPADIAAELEQALTPSFDTNKNDIWSKRMNTLRRFIALTSRWLVRRRLDLRMATIKQTLADAGCTTREECKAWVARESEEYKSKNGGAAGGAKKKDGLVRGQDAQERPEKLAELLCAMPNEEIERNLKVTDIMDTGKFEVDQSMARRVLFPRFAPDDAAVRAEITPVGIYTDGAFDDRTYFKLKTKPEYLSLGYTHQQAPPVPFNFPTSNKALRAGGKEESTKREAVDAEVLRDYLMDTEPAEDDVEATALDGIFGRDKGFFGKVIRGKKTAEEVEEDLKLGRVDPEGEDAPVQFVDDITYGTPAWMDKKAAWSAEERDFFRPRPDLRTYVPRLMHKESDADWRLRPGRPVLTLPEDHSTLTRFLEAPGFLSAHQYLLAGHESRSKVPWPAGGPTSSDNYMADLDRRPSGLYCYSEDHKRPLHAWDATIKPMMRRQDRSDHLTDSESDEEDYQVPKPSIQRVRQLLGTAVATEPAAEGDAEGGNLPAPDSLDEDYGFDKLEEKDKRRDQVELMSDRKALEMEQAIRRERNETHEKLADKLVKLSEAAACVVNAVHVQRPFHVYAEDLYKTMDERDYFPMQKNIVEAPSNASSVLGGSTFLLSPPASPTKAIH